MRKIPYVLLMILAALLASACSLDGSGLPTPTYTLLATFPLPAAPEETPMPLMTEQPTEVIQVVITDVVPVTQVVVTQVAVAQSVVVPTQDPTCTPPAGWQPYTVVAGDTLGALAIRTFSSVDELVSANCIPTPDLIYAEQTLYVPRAPGAFLPAAITDGTDVPSVNNILVEPSIVMNATYTVTPGIVTVRAGAVDNAASVTFYMAPIGQESTPVVLGEDANLADGATVTWEIGTVPLRANVWAIATDATGRQVTSEPILVQANV